MSDSNAGLIFAYGTLRGDVPENVRPAGARHARQALANGAAYVGSGSVAGQLYAVAWYPGFIAAGPRDDRVRGEVWRMRNPDKLLPILDDYESAEYVRERRTVRLDDGRKLKAWVYRYAGDVSHYPRIASGDYLDWVHTKEQAR